jgi:antitoxin VapB
MDTTDRSALEEIAVKQQRTLEFLRENGLAGVLLRRRENVAWITAGQSDRTIVMPSESAIASVLLLLEGRRIYFSPNNEALRLADEDFNGLEFEPVEYGWQEDLTEQRLRQWMPRGALASDSHVPGCRMVNLAPLRWQLLPQEIDRYRRLCQITAEAAAQVLLNLEPGVTEHEMAARVSYALLRDGVEPTVLLMAVDNRVRSYKHALPQDGVLQRLGMLNLCARRWGLAASVTRYVHFGPAPQELAAKFAATARVHAALLDATRRGRNADQCFQVAAENYAACGFPGEELLHHQGGAAGYLEREWLARPGGQESPVSPQVFAWNPNINGAKTEETVLVQDGKVEPLTLTESLPTVTTELGNESYESTGLLIR